MPLLFIILQYLLPKQCITILAGKFANAKAGRLTTAVIRWFINRYQVNISEAAETDIYMYATFNDFFTRALRENTRPISNSSFICPVDGAISQFGGIKQSQIFQAKGHKYSTTALLAGNRIIAEKFENGSFATLYLSPKDYHRIHMPCAGRLISMTYVPGSLFSVNPTTAQGVPGLFARNERVICEFESPEVGTFIVVLVGATIVGSMATTWHGITPRTKSIRTWRYDDQAIELRKGEEMGRFLLGSTVVMLFSAGKIGFNADWDAGKTVKLGEVMGNKP